ncbi:MAG: WYL domain-containing protein [Oscillospiraceae bacterium]|nr:WYL domain-containing protein [Oscillospiraceae bacterium]
MKGQTIFQLLTLLQEETDEQHRLSQQAISDRMLARFGVKVNRRTLKGYLDELIEAGFPLSTSKKTRTLPDGTTEVLQTDWYMEPRFELSELRLITDLLTAMPAVPKSQKDALIEKLMMHTSPLNRQAHPTQKLVYLDTPPAQQLLYSVDILLEAIRRNKMVKFLYCSYQLDGNNRPVLVPRKSSDGADREYLVSPYEIAVSHGRYYLMCCKEPYRSVAHYRIDRITEIEIKDDFERLPLDQLNTAHTLPENLAEQLYMYSGDTITCEFLADARILGDILDWFGTAAQISRTEHPAELLVRVHVHPKAMQHWALQYGEWVTVLSPDTFCAELSEVIGSLARRYATPPAPIRKS